MGMLSLCRGALMPKAIGSIAVQSFEPEREETRSGATSLGEVHISERFSGDIEADGVVRALRAVGSDGTASFCAFEHVEGTLAGRHGSFLLLTEATSSAKAVKGMWYVVPGSGTGGLVGLSGHGGFDGNLGQGSSYWLDYELGYSSS
jgi:hypothetical protein